MTNQIFVVLIIIIMHKYVNFSNLGTQFHEGEPVYPEENSADAWKAVFPNAPLLPRQGDKQPPYVFVWKTWGKERRTYFTVM